MGAFWGAAVNSPSPELGGQGLGFSAKADPHNDITFDPRQRRYKRRLPERPVHHLSHKSALRDYSITSYGANGCAYFKLPEEATAAAVQLKTLLLYHGDELREWLGKDVFNTMDSVSRR